MGRSRWVTEGKDGGVPGLKKPGLVREMAVGAMHVASLSISSWRKELPLVARDQRLAFRRFLKMVCKNPGRWLIEPSHPLDVRRQIHTSTVRIRRKKGSDDSRRGREDYVVWSCWSLFVSGEMDLLMEANLGRPPSWTGADGWSHTGLCCERGSENDWRLLPGVVRRWCAWNLCPHARTGRPASGGFDALHVYLIHSIEVSSDRHYHGLSVELGDEMVASRAEEVRESGA